MTDQVTDQVTETEQTQESYLSKLVGEGKKYASEEALAKSRLDADEHIARVEAEAAELREKLAGFQQQEDRFNTILNIITPKDEGVQVNEPEPVKTDPVVVTEQKQPEPDVDLDVALKAHEFAKLGESKYGDFEIAKAKLKEYVGDSVEKQKLATTLMRTDPNALIRILPDPEVPVDGSITSRTKMTTSSTHNLPLTWTAAQEVLRKDPKRYRSDEYQTKLKEAWQAAEAVGIKFINT